MTRVVRSVALAIILHLLSVSLIGCSGSTIPTVKVRGKLVDGAHAIRPDPQGSLTLIFVQQEAEDRRSSFSGYLDEAGGFEVLGREQSGVPVGKYQVMLQPMAPKPSPAMQTIQNRFGNDQSPIVIDIQPSDEPLVIDLATYKRK